MCVFICINIYPYKSDGKRVNIKKKKKNKKKKKKKKKKKEKTKKIKIKINNTKFFFKNFFS